MSAVTLDQVHEAFDTLAKYGEEYYKPEYRKNVSKWDKAGRALSAITNTGENLAQMLFAALEEWNYHAQCFVIDWIFNLGGTIHQEQLSWLQDLISKEVEVKTDFDTETLEYKTKRARVSVAVEWLD
jgi:hypothetical protein